MPEGHFYVSYPTWDLGYPTAAQHIRSTSGRYASYWNAVLYCFCNQYMRTTMFIQCYITWQFSFLLFILFFSFSIRLLLLQYEYVVKKNDTYWKISTFNHFEAFLTFEICVFLTSCHIEQLFIPKATVQLPNTIRKLFLNICFKLLLTFLSQFIMGLWRSTLD